MNTTFNKVAKLLYIKENLKRGEQVKLAKKARINQGKLSVYLLRPDKFNLNYSLVDRIIEAFDLIIKER